MSPSSQSLRERFRNDLRSGSLSVLLVVIPLAMLAGTGGGRYSGDSGLGFALLLVVGVFVPYAHESHWPQDRSRARDAAWTVAASVVAVGLFAASYLLAATVLGDSIHTVPVAFAATVLCSEAMGRLVRRTA